MNEEFCNDLIKKAGEIIRFIVGAVIVIDSKVLLLQRPEVDFMGGIYEFPSGKVEIGESLLAALHREVKEETGLNILKIIKYVGHFDYESKSGKKTRQFNFAVIVSDSSKLKLTEHDNYIWSREEELSKYEVTDCVKEILKIFWNKDV
ncbi:MAG: NUDIX domain-containing protein [Nanoarchaeota archaeon]|nr:NUDIX domain-containing protein [Nanoarchaeota archaeon]